MATSRATVMHGAGDVRIENVPDATILLPTDAVIRVTRACICGSDLWPYQSMQPCAMLRRVQYLRGLCGGGTSFAADSPTAQ